MAEIVFDVESYWDVFLVGMKRLSDGKIVILEESARSKIDRDYLRRILLNNTMIGFNSMTYDAAVIWYFLDGKGHSEVKEATNRIILGNLKYWEVEDALKIRIPWDFKNNHIDLIEPQPNPFASLKILHGRMHGPNLQDLPYAPEQELTFDEIDHLREYLHNDLAATERLWYAMKEGMDLRRQTGESIGQNLMSKSDTQMGLSIIKKRAEEITKKKIERSSFKAGQSFHYKAPPYIKFKDPKLQDMLRKIQEHRFIVGNDGKVDLPKFFEEEIVIGKTTYAMGIGGLHSTESNRGIRSTESDVLIDVDVASYYPAIILTLGLYPDAVGPDFLKVYQGIRADRLAAKKAKNKQVDKALKIALNGAFGSLGSRFSFVYAPHLMIAVTITGQLALLMLIEQGERMGIPAVSGNTDGVVFRCSRSKFTGLDGDRPKPSEFADLITGWEQMTGFNLEANEYDALYSQSVNSYFAIKVNGGHKRKGPFANPWSEDPNDADARAALMKNPQMTICSDAALARIKHGTPLRDTISGCKDMRQFVTVIKATKGATWRGRYLGKVVRYYWAKGGDDITEAVPNAATGNFKKIAKTEGAAECMRLPDTIPSDLNIDRYVEEAEMILKEIGFFGTVAPPEKRIRITKKNWRQVLSTWMVQL